MTQNSHLKKKGINSGELDAKPPFYELAYFIKVK